MAKLLPYSVTSLSVAIVCDGKELEPYGVQQGDRNSITAFVASEVGKVFKVTFTYNNLSPADVELLVHLYIDGKRTERICIQLQAGQRGEDEVLGIQKSATSVLPFKFQELQLVDPDLFETAPVVPEMGMVEVRVFRVCLKSRRKQRKVGLKHSQRLHQGRVSERSKQAGWHHVGTADEIHSKPNRCMLILDHLDPLNAPYMTFKVFYRPKEMLMAQGVIPGYSVGAVSEVNDRKRAREDGLPGPSKRHAGPTVKKEDMSADDREQEIQVLQAKLNSLIAERSRSSFKCEPRSPSPIVVGKAAGEVVDLTLED